MKETIYVSTVGERFMKVMEILGDTVKEIFDPVPGIDEHLIRIEVTESRWTDEIKPRLLSN